MIKYLATHWSRLTDVDSGSAVKTYRQLQIEKAHLPVELWESDVFDPENPDAWFFLRDEVHTDVEKSKRVIAMLASLCSTWVCPVYLCMSPWIPFPYTGFKGPFLTIVSLLVLLIHDYYKRLNMKRLVFRMMYFFMTIPWKKALKIGYKHLLKARLDHWSTVIIVLPRCVHPTDPGS